ncbi:Ig-like domain-containing protein [Staphylococcus chromogenes]|uniref:Ig-like domain-containing protein n=1 Tax=Staphylococcus chromogenes TaxID=46126 RepID=UPI002883F95A|nr:Ig-like domain-containing protein [Staphylococcus chromogenes]MDT0716181.1 Ig-like domain-containing protein [Staphylococcus chromogenes]
MDTKRPKQYPRARQTYAIRKFNIGLASVMFGTFLFLSVTDHVKAAESDNGATTSENLPPDVHKEVIQPSEATLENDKVTPENDASQTTDTVTSQVEQPKESSTPNTPQEFTADNVSLEKAPQETTAASSPEVNSQDESLKDETPVTKQNEATAPLTSEKEQGESELRATTNTTVVPAVNEPAPEANATEVSVDGIEERVYQKSIPVLKGSKIARTIGMGRGNSQARESLGVVLPADTTLYVRQAKPTNEADLKVNLVTDDSQTNQTAVVSKDGTWTSIRTTVDSAAFMYMPRGLESEPLIEYYIENNLFQALPTYRKGQNQETFETQWVDQDASFAFVDGDKHAILIPRVDRDRVLAMKTNTSKFLFTSLDELITYYDDVVTHYDQWAGLIDDPTSVSYNFGHKYFTMPDKNGIGTAYWSNDHMGMNSNSVYGYLEKGWLILHEIGHGYDGVMAQDKNVNLLEVINNVYAHHYEQEVQKLGSDWLYQNKQTEAQQRIHDTYLSGNTDFTFNSLGGREKLDFMTRMTRFAGMDAFAGMLQQMREQAAREGLPTDVPRWLGEYMLAQNGANALAYFDLFHVPTSPQLEDRLNTYNNSYIYPLASLITDEAERQKYVDRLDLKTIYELVKSSDLADTTIQAPATITVNLNGQTLPQHAKVQLKDGSTIVAEAVVQNGRVLFDSVRAGVYKVVAPVSTTYALPEHTYLIVSENVENTATLNYPEPSDVQKLMTQQIAIKGLSDGVVSTITFNPSTKEVAYRHNNGQPHIYFENQPYAQVTIQTQNGEVLLDKIFIGDEKLTATEQTFTMNYGDTITVMHKEAESRRQVLRPETGERLNFQDAAMQTVTYTLTDKGFIVNNETQADADARYLDALESDIERVTALMDAHPERDYRTQLYRIAEGLPYTDTANQTRLRALLAPYLDQAQLDAPKVNPVQLDQRQVYGTATPHATITVTLPNNEVLQTTTNAQGVWGVTVPTTTPLQVNDTLAITASMEGLQASQAVATKVIDTIAPNTPNIYTPQAGTDVVNGSAQPNVMVKVTFANGETVETTALANGTWSVQAPAPLMLGEAISASAHDAAGNTSGTMSTQVIDTIPPQAPGVSNLEYGDNIVRGTGEHYRDIILVRFPDGQIMQTKVGKNGTWMVGVPYETQVQLNVGDVIYVFEYDQSNNRSQPAYAYVVDTTAPKAPVVNTVTEGDSVITGQSEPNSHISIALNNGEVIETYTTADGTFTIDVPNSVVLLENNSFNVTATDIYGNASTPTVTTVQPKEEVVPPEPVIFPIREGDRTISGTSVPLSRVIIVIEDTNAYGVTADENGNYTLQLPDAIQLYENNRINAFATDTKGHDSGLIVTFVGPKAEVPVEPEQPSEPEPPVVEEPTEETPEQPSEPEPPVVEEPTEETPEEPSEPEPPVVEEPTEETPEPPSEPEPPVVEEPTEETPEEPSEPEPPVVEEPTEEMPEPPSEPEPPVVEEPIEELPEQPSEPEPPVVEEPTEETPEQPSEPEPPVVEEPTEETREEPSEPEPPVVEEPTEETPEQPSEPEPPIVEEPSEPEPPVVEEPTEKTSEQANVPESSTMETSTVEVSPITSQLEPSATVSNEEIQQPIINKVGASQAHGLHALESEAEVIAQVDAYYEEALQTKVSAPVHVTQEKHTNTHTPQVLPETGDVSTSTKTGWLLTLLGLPFIVRVFKRRKES